jgi:hypothetical protein
MIIALSIGGRFALSMWLIHLRKGFNSLMICQNKCAFDGCNYSLAAALRLAREEAVCLSLAGAKALLTGISPLFSFFLIQCAVLQRIQEQRYRADTLHVKPPIVKSNYVQWM